MPPPSSLKPAPAATTSSSAPDVLLVLDTNVVLDWVAFGDARMRPIAAAIERGSLHAVTNAACLQELRRALGYAQVKLGAAAQALAYGRYLAHAQSFEIADGVLGARGAQLPRCEDPDDQKFLELAWHARASHLLTRDHALLRLARELARSGRFSVLAPEDFLLPAPGLAPA